MCPVLIIQLNSSLDMVKLFKLFCLFPKVLKHTFADVLCILNLCILVEFLKDLLLVHVWELTVITNQYDTFGGLRERYQ